MGKKISTYASFAYIAAPTILYRLLLERGLNFGCKLRMWHRNTIYSCVLYGIYMV